MKKKSVSEEKGLFLTKEHASAMERTEEVGTAMMRTGTQMILATEEILADEFGFSEGDIKRFENKFKWMMKTLHNLKRNSLTVMSPQDMEDVAKIAERWQMEDKAQKIGLDLPESVKQKLIKH